jgi:predicted nucleic acid-binding protein
MNDNFFLDTNIFVYCFDESQPQKRKLALSLIAEALHTGKGIISTQVIQEFLNVATRKFTVPLKPDDGRIYLEKVLNPLCHVFPDLDLYKNALLILNETNFSFYDALIIAGAIRGGCTTLLSEDFSSGQQVEQVKIINPFVEENYTKSLGVDYQLLNESSIT